MATGAPVRAALVGYGLAGECFHAPFLATTPGVELASIVTGNPERRARVAARWPSARLLGSADELWARAGEHDLVVVASANRAHESQALAAIAAGLAVVVDKPLAPSSAAARRVVDAATARGVLLTVFQNRRWDSDVLTLRRLMDEGALGEIWRVESRFERWRPEVRPAWRESADPADGGGLLLDLGTHLVDQAVQLFGWPEAAWAEVRRRRPGAAVDDDTFVALHHPNGVITHCWTSVVAGEPGPRLRVLGSAGTFVVDDLDPQEAALRDGRTPSDPGYGEVPPERWGRLVAGGVSTPVPAEPGAYQRFYEGVVASLRTGAPPPVDAGDAVRVLELLESLLTP